MEGISAGKENNGRAVQNAQLSTSNSGKPSGMSSPADGETRAPRRPKKGRNPQTRQNKSSPGQQQTGNGSNNNDHFASIEAVVTSPGASRAPKRGVGYRRGGGRGRGSARRNVAPQHPDSAQQPFQQVPEPRPSDDLIELMEDSPAIAPGPTAPSRPGPNPPSSKASASKAHAAAKSDSRQQGQHRGPGKRLLPKARQTGFTAAATAPIRRRNDPELSIPKASDIRAAGLIEDSEDESAAEEEAVPVERPVNEASEAPEPDSFYRSIDKTYRQARAQRTCEFPRSDFFAGYGTDAFAVFTVPISALNRHNQLLHDRMRTSLPSGDESLINGFEQCNVIADRLLKRVSGLDTGWAAQLQRMQHEYEDQLHAQKVVNERMLKHMQKEVERWQEKCEKLGAGQAGKIKSEVVRSGPSSGFKSPAE